MIWETPLERFQMMKNILLTWALYAGSAVGGTLLFSNGPYGPDGISIGVNPFLPGTPQSIAATRFELSQDAILDFVLPPLAILQGPVQFNVFLMSDAASLPGAVIESYSVTSIPTGSPPAPAIIPSVLHPYIVGGTPYWIAITTPSFGEWFFTAFQGDSGGSPNFATGSFIGGTAGGWVLGTGGPTGREGALQLQGTFVPEPNSLFLAGISIAGLLLLSRLRAS
jgi:hypothetical protein